MAEGPGVAVVYTPFVESDDRNKWHAKQGPRTSSSCTGWCTAISPQPRASTTSSGPTTPPSGTARLQACYPGDAFVDVIGKSAYGSGLVFDEYAWAVEKKRNRHGKVIWWAELGIRGKNEPPATAWTSGASWKRTFPELAGFVFWSDEGFYNVIGNRNGRELMTHRGVVTAETRRQHPAP
jgi:hypothetical protein